MTVPRRTTLGLDRPNPIVTLSNILYHVIPENQKRNPAQNEDSPFYISSKSNFSKTKHYPTKHTSETPQNNKQNNLS